MKDAGNRYHKFCICIDPIRRFFIYINTDQSRRYPDGDILVKVKDGLNFLSHDSYVNTSYILRIFDYSIESRGPLNPVGSLPKAIINQLIQVIHSNKEITYGLKKAIWNQLDEIQKNELKECEPVALKIPKYEQKTKTPQRH